MNNKVLAVAFSMAHDSKSVQEIIQATNLTETYVKWIIDKENKKKELRAEKYGNFEQKPFEYYFEGDGLIQTRKEMAKAARVYKDFRFEQDNAIFISKLVDDAKNIRKRRKK